MELLINKAIGGFGFSKKFCKLFLETYKFDLAELCIDDNCDFSFSINVRSNSKVLELFKKMGSKFSSSSSSELEIINADFTKEFYIDDVDGVEEIIYL